VTCSSSESWSLPIPVLLQLCDTQMRMCCDLHSEVQYERTVHAWSGAEGEQLQDCCVWRPLMQAGCC